MLILNYKLAFIYLLLNVPKLFTKIFLHRGHLNLTLLPSSSMCLSFTGDDGCTERLATLSNNFDSSQVVIEEISADRSGRSFRIKLPGSQVLFFWCSEKSKLHGSELLARVCYCLIPELQIFYCRCLICH